MILIVDNGSQYTHLIKRSCRELGKEAEIVNNSVGFGEAVQKKEKNIDSIILSGGPGSVYKDGAELSGKIIESTFAKKLHAPLLGICFGQQAIAYAAGAEVARGKSAEYGISEIIVDNSDKIFDGVPDKFKAWVSHYDEVKELPKDFIRLAHSDNCKI